MIRAAPDAEDRIDHGATGPAMEARPSRLVETIQAGVTRKEMQGAHLVDRMHAASQLSDRQYAAALRVLDMHSDAGFEPKLCGSYAPRGWAAGHDDDDAERAGITRFRQLLAGKDQDGKPRPWFGEQSAWLLHSMCLEQHPGVRFLPLMQKLLSALASEWGIEP